MSSFGIREGTLPEFEAWLQEIGVSDSKVATVLKGIPPGLVNRLHRPGWKEFLQPKLAALERLGLSKQDIIRAIIAYPNILALK